MPEVTAAELKRLKAIERRIAKVSDDREALRAVRDDLKAQVVVLNRVVRDTEKELKLLTAATAKTQSELQERVAALVAENNEQAQRLARADGDVARLTAVAEKLKASTDELAAKSSQQGKANAGLSKKVAGLEAGTSRLKGQLKTARSRLKATGKPVALEPAETARLIEGFVGEFGASSGGLVVREADVTLKVAFDAVDGAGGFVIPTVGSVVGESSELHEIHISLSRSADAIEPEGTST
jgi:predicted  nucleic acid-binding Zn-ribbon protein